MVNLDNFILFDVAVAIVTDKDTGEAFIQSYLKDSGYSQTSNETEIRGGQGNALLAIVESEKSAELTLASATVGKKWLEMQQGGEFKTGQKVIMTKTEKVKVTVDETDPDNPIYQATIVGTPVNDKTKITVVNCKGEQEADNITRNEKVITLPSDFAEKDDTVTILYKAELDPETEVLEIDSNVFPKGWELQLAVPAMDRCSQKVTHNVVFIFDNVRPSSSFDMSFTAGDAIAPEMTVKVMKGCCSSKLGRIALVPIDETP